MGTEMKRAPSGSSRIAKLQRTGSHIMYTTHTGIYSKISTLTLVILMILSPLGPGFLFFSNDSVSAQDGGSDSVTMDYIPELLNFTLESHDDYEDLEESSDNVTLLHENDNGILRLSTGLPDITVTGPYQSNGEYGETIIMKAGSKWMPDGGDSIEIYARNFIMERGSTIDVSGLGDNILGEGDDGDDGANDWRGGGGGGGGGYGDKGGDGGIGGWTGGSGGNGGDDFGEPGGSTISYGGKGGDGGDGVSDGGKGGEGGGIVKIVADNIFINGSIECEGNKGTTSDDSSMASGGGGGGGAGGGMIIIGNKLEFSDFAILSVVGGEGGDSGDTNIAQWYDSGGSGGGGGGGRIKILNDSSIIGQEKVTMNVIGGAGGEPGAARDSWRTGEMGEPGANGTFSISANNFEFPLDYHSQGVFISKPFDTDNPSPHYDGITFSAETPGGTYVAIHTQTANSSATNPDIPGDWTEWSEPHTVSGEKIASPGYRWIRAKIVLLIQGDDKGMTPYFDRLKIEYHTDEAPTDLQISVEPTIINAAHESAVFTTTFRDTDQASPGVFEGILKLRNNATSEELTLMNGTLEDNDNCVVSLNEDGLYRANYTFSPDNYVRDGLWEVHFEIYDGVTGKKILGYDDSAIRLEIFTNFPSTLDPGSLSVSNGILPIPDNYDTVISFDLVEVDPFPVRDFRLAMKLINGTTVYDMIEEKPIGSVPDLELSRSRGSYHLAYTFDPDEAFAAGEYGIDIEIRDNKNELYGIRPNETDITLDLKMDYPPSSPSWILPNSTAEQTPRIVWSEALDKEGDELTYSIQIGTGSLRNDVLVRSSTGINNFYDVTRSLPFGEYYVQVWSRDTYFFSQVLEEKMIIDENANTPPRPPTSIMPNFTKEIQPKITWSGAYDIDNDELTYFIEIGEVSGDSVTLSKRSTGDSPFYQVQHPLERGKEFLVRVWAFDGFVESYPREETLSVLTKGNHRPEPPTAIYPDVTGDPKPTIFWPGGIDSDEDELSYFIQIGSSPGNGDILQWTPTGTETSFMVPFNLSYGTYYVQVKCFDSVLESLVIEESLNIWAVGNIPPTAPTEINPTFTVKRFPDIWWSGAHDENEDDLDLLFYFIRIGANPNGNEILAWQVTLDPYYNVTTILPDGVYYVQVMSSDGKVNSSIYQHKLYVGTFKPVLELSPDELIVKRGNIYEVKLNVTNLGTIPDRIRLDFSELNGITIIPRDIDLDISAVILGPGEYFEIALTVSVLNSYSSKEQLFNVTATSLSGANTSISLSINRYEESTGFDLEQIYRESWFWLAVIIIVFIMVIVIMLVVRRKRRWGDDDGATFTETVKTRSRPAPIKKKSGMVTRISETPIMDPRAKRIAMAIYGAQQAQLNPVKKKDLPALPASTQNLPKIMVPDMAVGSTMSKKAHAIKALPQFSVVKDKSAAPTGQPDITGIHKEATAPARQPTSVPSVTMPGDIGQEPQVSSGKMNEITSRVLNAQTRIIQLRNDGVDVKEAEDKLIMANQYFGQMNIPALENTLNEIDAVFRRLENERDTKAKEPKAAPDFEIQAPPPEAPKEAPPIPTKTVSAAPAAPSAAPPDPAIPPESPPEAPGSPAPPAPPKENAPPLDEKKDVFSDLQNIINGMK